MSTKGGVEKGPVPFSKQALPRDGLGPRLYNLLLLFFLYYALSANLSSLSPPRRRKLNLQERIGDLCEPINSAKEVLEEAWAQVKANKPGIPTVKDRLVQTAVQTV